MVGIVHNESALAIVAALLGLCATLLGLDGPHWERTFARAHEEAYFRRDAEARLYRTRPGAETYRLVPALALRRRIKGRRARYVARAERFESLSEPLKKEAAELAHAWIASVGAFAEEVGGTRQVALRPFLATNHLAVIRQGVVVVPIAISLLVDGLLSEEEEGRLAWGLALMQLAIRYNSVVRQQREPVYFAAQGHEPPIGPVLTRPGFVRRGLYDILDRVPNEYRIRKLRYWWSRLWIGWAARRLQASRTTPA